LNVKVHQWGECAANGWLCLGSADGNAPRTIKAGVDIRGDSTDAKSRGRAAACIPDYQSWDGESGTGNDHSSQGDRQHFQFLHSSVLSAAFFVVV
jgi:hypothetical protein